MMHVKHLLALTLFFVSTQTVAYETGRTYNITVLHTNDHHGAFWKNTQGEYGMAARATLIEKIRKEVKTKGGHVLLLSGGDINTGTPESELADAEPDFRGMRMMKYDAMAIGNHEFDKPLATLRKQQDEWSNFPFLSANIYEKDSQNRAFKPFLIKSIGGLKVALLGLTTDQTPQQSIRFPHNKLELKSPIDEAKIILPSLSKKSHIVIAVTHMGHYPDGNHGSRSPGDVTLAREVSGIDLIVGGHSQKPLLNIDTQNNTTIVQAGEWGKHLGRVDIEFKDGHFKVVDYKLIPVNLRDSTGSLIAAEIKENQSLIKVLKPFKDSATKMTDEVVGELHGKLEGHRSVIRKQETNLGNLVTYLMAKSTGADIAVTDSGVIRTSLESGKVTYGNILSVHPVAFGLKYTYVDFTGEELWSYLSKVSFKTSGAYPQFYGLKIKTNSSELVSVNIKQEVTGEFEKLDRGKTYRLALTDFIARGGDGYPVVNTHPAYRETNVVDAQAMKSFFIQQGRVRAVDFSPIGNLIFVK